MKRRVVIIGGGLCGSVLGTLLRNKFHVTIIEQGKKPRPLFDDVESPAGEVNTSINRAEGLGGTTNYWHNALIELDDTDLRNAGLDPSQFRPYYDAAWSIFLSEPERHQCTRIRENNRAADLPTSWTFGHMVVPYARANVWQLANARYPGDAVDVVHGSAERFVPAENGRPAHVVVRRGDKVDRIEADYCFVCAGGLATPVFLARSVGPTAGLCGGYHDHPMAYVAKIRLRPNSWMKHVSCNRTPSADVRSGFVREVDGMKTVFYLRPAMNLKLKSICGPGRYVLSDLRNDPFSPKKILRLLTNLDALKEAVLFKSKAGFVGDDYSVLMLGEQIPNDRRGVMVNGDDRPVLNWHVSDSEHQAYRRGFESFLSDFATEIAEHNVIPTDRWEYRTAAHHSGCAERFMTGQGGFDLSSFALAGVPNAFVCDASVLRAGGIANSGLTLVALCHRLAERAIAEL